VNDAVGRWQRRLSACVKAEGGHFEHHGNRTFRYFASSPLGRFTTTLDASLPGRFAPLDVSIPGRFATSLEVSPTDDKDYIANITVGFL